MPIYEYRCESCGHEMEVMQKLADDPLKDCPDCEQPALKKLISAVAFRLKGSGWYETDFKTGDEKKNLAAGDDKPAAKTSDGKSDSKSDAKSDSGSKTETKSDSKSSSETKSDSKSTSDTKKSSSKKTDSTKAA